MLQNDENKDLTNVIDCTTLSIMTKKSIPFQIRISKELKKQIELLAEDLGIPPSTWCKMQLKKVVNKEISKKKGGR